MNTKTAEEMLKEGPPKEPSFEAPGPILRLLVHMAEEIKKRTDKDVPADEMVLLLAHILDVANWKSETAAFHSLQKMKYSLTEIVR